MSSLSWQSSTAQGKQSSEDLNIEREARERVAAMMYRSAPASIDYDCSQTSIITDSFDGEFAFTYVFGARSAPTLKLIACILQALRNILGAWESSCKLKGAHLQTTFGISPSMEPTLKSQKYINDLYK